jgi:hypothetical protein
VQGASHERQGGRDRRQGRRAAAVDPAHMSWPATAPGRRSHQTRCSPTSATSAGAPASPSSRRSGSRRPWAG